MHYSIIITILCINNGFFQKQKNVSRSASVEHAPYYYQKVRVDSNSFRNNIIYYSLIIYKIQTKSS